MKGKIIKWFGHRGFGFIKPLRDGADIFVHHSDVKDSFALREGEHVEFETEWTERGLKAIKVRKIAPENQIP